MKKVIVTTSWDDGHKLDLKVVELLKKYKLKGTFYVAPKNREFDKKDLLTEKEVVEISKDFEIGGHTITHPLLPNDFSNTLYKIKTKILKKIINKKDYKITPNISTEEAEKEIRESKIYLEKLLNKKIITFAYTAGRNNKTIQNLVKKSGFKYARTADRHKFEVGDNLYAVPTTLHAFAQYQDAFKILKFSNWNLKTFIENLDWEILSKRMFDKMPPGKVFHFWGHSWIIDEKDEWDKLERVFAYISNRENAVYIENKDLLNLK